MFPISLCMIVKNGESTLRQCLESVKSYVDEIVIVDTGSTDKTKEIAKEYTDKIYDFEWIDDFSAARNFSFSKATHDLIFWMDADDVLFHGENFKPLVAQTFAYKEIGVLMLPYHYERNPQGLLVAEHLRERVVRKGWFTWKGRVHETFIPLRQFSIVKEQSVHIEHKHVVTLESIKDKHERNLYILQKQLEDEKKVGEPDPRTIYYLATTLMGLNRGKEALPLFEKYVTVSGWDEEIYFAFHRMCQISIGLKDWQKAIDYAFHALEIKPKHKDAYFDLGKIYYYLGQLDKAEKWLTDGLSLPIVETLLVVNPREHDYNPLLLLSDIYMRRGDAEKAIACYHKLEEFSPNNPQITYSRNIAIQLMNQKLAAQALINITEFCLQNEQILKAYDIIESVPNALRDMPGILRQRLRIKKIMDRIKGYDKGIRKIDQCMYVYAKPNLKVEPKLLKLKELLAILPGEIKSILDVGCFNGWLANDLAKTGLRVTGVDIGEEGLAVARADAEKENTGAKFEICNVNDVGIQYHKKFDAVTCFDVLEHVVSPEKLIDQLEKACKPGGWVFLNIPNGAWHQGAMDTQYEELWEHIRSFEYRDIVKLLAGRKNLLIFKLDSIDPRKLISPGQSMLFIAYQNVVNTGRLVELVCTPTPEEWSPLSVKSGIGGSEEAVINMANELFKLGYKVIVYNSCDELQGVYNSIPYININHFDHFAVHDILISWRNPLLFNFNYDSKLNITWLHDVQNPEIYTPELLKNIDKIIVLSKFHRANIPNVPDEKIYISRNGVDTALFENQTIERKKHKIVYSSSPDRGLDALLSIWDDIKKEVPDAELHVYYGFECYDKLRTSPKEQAWKAHMLQLMTKDGIVNHGRVGHEELAKEFLSADIWAYPTYFPEISCITAMKAQIAGVIPVCTDYAALEETVKYGIKIPGDSRDPKVLQVFKCTLIETLKSDNEGLRNQMIEKSKGIYSWKEIAKEWTKSIFRGGRV